MAFLFDFRAQKVSADADDSRYTAPDAARSGPTSLEPPAPAGYGQLRCTTCLAGGSHGGPVACRAKDVLLDTGEAAACAPALALRRARPRGRSIRSRLPLDKPDVWTLHFRYKPPRIIEVDALDKDGKHVKKVVWYMWYQVYNRSGEPQTFLPEFELVTKDLNTTHLDEPQPYIFEQIKKIEDTTISHEKPNGTRTSRPRSASRSGRSSRACRTRFRAWCPAWRSGPTWPRRRRRPTSSASTSPACRTGWPSRRRPTGEKLIKRKTLQINFLRPTDDNTAADRRHRPGRPERPGREVDLPHRVVRQAEGCRKMTVITPDHARGFSSPAPPRSSLCSPAARVSITDAVFRPVEFQFPHQLLRVDRSTALHDVTRPHAVCAQVSRGVG